jgi:inorganic phosphate transporter, PiT family
MSTLGLVVVIICIALAFDFVNGFHDAANSVATVVATRVLSPAQAVGMAGVFNFLAAFFLGTGVAATVGKGFVNTSIVTPYVLLAGLVGAILWNVLTWYFGLPISSSHALIGGYAGAALAKAGIGGLIVGKWPSTLAFIVVAPLMGLVLGYLLMVAVYWIFHAYTPAHMDRFFRHAQILSAAHPVMVSGGPIRVNAAGCGVGRPAAISAQSARNGGAVFMSPGHSALAGATRRAARD